MTHNTDTKAASPSANALRAIGHSIKMHPRAWLLGLACSIGIVIMLQNWHATKATVLVVDVGLPFGIWGVLFAATGYGIGRWIEWTWVHRQSHPGPSPR